MPPTVIREIRRVGEPLPTGRLLPVLAADALPGVEVVGDGVHRGHHLDRASDQVGAADRRGDLAAFDQERLRASEDEVAARRD